MKFLVTGHTGFKGAWLTLLLARLGHEVSGVALDPLPNALFARANVPQLLREDFRLDIRDSQAIRDAVTTSGPDAVIHLAAQSLVRESYRRPRETMEVNAMGTLNVLEAAAACPTVGALLIVTTDKVYRNDDRGHAFRESDPLGGRDPYSASKSMADILTQAWLTSFPGVSTAIARAGNVIGGGDVSSERLVPDTLKALGDGNLPEIRVPHAVRPWQHVLDCLYGYVVLTQALIENPGQFGGAAWNFGPSPDSFIEVLEVVRRLASLWGVAALDVPVVTASMPEARSLMLDSTKASNELGWKNILNLDATLSWVAEWQMRVDGGAHPFDVTVAQVERYLALVLSP